MSRSDGRTYRPGLLDASTSAGHRPKTYHGYRVDSEAVADAILRTPLLADYRHEPRHDRRLPGPDRPFRGSAPVVFDADYATWVRSRRRLPN